MHLDFLARRYRRLPSEVLALSPFDLALTIQCAEAGQAAATRLMGQINSAGMPVFPTRPIE